MTINGLKSIRAAVVRAAAVAAIGAAAVTGSASIASAQTQPTAPPQAVTTCVLHTQNRGVVFSQETYGDCFQLMYASRLNRPAHNAGTHSGAHQPKKWIGEHTHSPSAQG